jgi:hypothetical protein
MGVDSNGRCVAEDQAGLATRLVVSMLIMSEVATGTPENSVTLISPA